jgi:hypothetical protein
MRKNGPKLNIRNAQKIRFFDVIKCVFLTFRKTSGHQTAINWPTTGQQLNTYKNEKNVKNEKKHTPVFLFIFIQEKGGIDNH